MRIFPPCLTCGERVRFEAADVMPLVKIDPIEIDIDFDAGEPWAEEASDAE